MTRSLSDRLVSLALAGAVTFALVSGIHTLAANEAAQAAAQLAHSALPICARV